MRSLGITLIRTKAHAPWQNGRVERMIRTIKSLVRRVMHNSPHTEWNKVLPWIVATLNATTARSTGLCPHEVFFGEKPKPLVEAVLPGLPPADLTNTTAEELESYV